LKLVVTKKLLKTLLKWVASFNPLEAYGGVIQLSDLTVEMNKSLMGNNMRVSNY